ncbi:MAG: lipopolysaccharide transporter periplasmic protein LptA [Deltaproteobacteria bacterium]|nr:lipopolysaccharide transporter periplasmic protein LptA [Deltaproteobacteria bacterium]
MARPAPVIGITAVLAAFLFVLGTVSVRAQQQKPAEPDKAEPIHITSDQVEAFQQQHQVVFSGHVVATQKDIVVRGDKMTVFYADKGQGDAKGSDLGGGSVDKIVVEGNVQITQGERVATGKVATYYRADNKVVLTGDPRVVRNQDSIQGDRITLFLDSEKSIVESGPSGRVQATIYSSGPKGAADGSKSGEGAKRPPATGDQGG